MQENKIQLEEMLSRWRNYHLRQNTHNPTELDDLEQQLRNQITNLSNTGLSTDETFLIALKRIGDHESLSREFTPTQAKSHWKQFVVAPLDAGDSQTAIRQDAVVAFCLAVLAAVLIKVPTLFGYSLDLDEGIYARNLSFFVLPLLAGYFIWKRRIDSGMLRWIILAFALALLFANIFPFVPKGSTEVLSALHLPIVLWLVVGIAYTGSRWKEVAGRMDFIRFSGELFIYYALIALGGGVLTAFIAVIFLSIGMDIEPFFESWLLPCGAIGAVVIASWLAEAKQSVIENMAPVLTRLFTPLFAAALITFLGAMLWTGRAIDIEREVLIAFDLLLVVVLGLLIYSISARDPESPPGAFDVLQVVLLVSALLANMLALWAIAGRITEFGFSPNRVAALGENIILMVNLAWSAVLYFRILKGSVPFPALERWQTDYLPVYLGWAVIVVVVFPLVFGFV